MKKVFLAVVLLVVIIVGITVSFHFTISNEVKKDLDSGMNYRVPVRIVMFAKEKLSFKDTFIGDEIIQREVNRYNDASPFSRVSIEAEYLHVKLKEYGLIWNENEDKNFDNFYFPNQSYTEDIISLSAHTLFSDYEQNTVSADQEYKNKMLSVTGEVYEVSSNDYSGIHIELAKWINYNKDWDYRDIKCYFSDKHKDEVAKIRKGQTITIQGKCVGKEFYSIELNNCSIIFDVEYDNGISDVDKVFAAWEKKLIANQIFDYVSESDCENLDLMMQRYEEGKYPMHVSEKTLVEFDYNEDGIKDYVLNYLILNCVQGNGYTSDFIFMTSKDSQLYINEELTSSLKRKYYDYVTQTYGEDSYVYHDKEFLVTKGLIINKIINNKCYGKFELSQDGASCCPKVSGEFLFDLKNDMLEVYNVKNEEY